MDSHLCNDKIVVLLTVRKHLRRLLQLIVAKTSQKWRPEVKAMFVRTSSSCWAYPLWLWVMLSVRPKVLTIEWSGSFTKRERGTYHRVKARLPNFYCL